ncbi:MAG: hypothetical protein ACJ750_04165 [Gaiellaceae bacterium]
MDTQTGSDRVDRAARNQTLFRQVNERLEELATAFQDIAGTAVFACECADLSCIEQINMTLDEYEAIRSHPNQFLVLPGHVVHDVEDIVRDGGGFVVVAKIGEGASLAAQTRPRI